MFQFFYFFIKVLVLENYVKPSFFCFITSKHINSLFIFLITSFHKLKWKTKMKIYIHINVGMCRILIEKLKWVSSHIKKVMDCFFFFFF